MIYLQLFISYLKIGFFGFGGGYAMLSLIHNEIVLQNQWLTNEEFTNIVAISQMTPGPIAINSATYVGYTVAGFWGSVVATLSVCLPALTLMIIITRFFMRLKENTYMKSVIAFMRPVVMGMILSGAMLLLMPSADGGSSFIDGWSWALFGIALIASLKKVNPIMLIVLSAVAGIAIYYLPNVL
ncbi:MAG: chromate transporter [Alistipes sp.]|nr:chromate transporter [Alistipes sp.]